MNFDAKSALENGSTKNRTRTLKLDSYTSIHEHSDGSYLVETENATPEAYYDAYDVLDAINGDEPRERFMAWACTE